MVGPHPPACLSAHNRRPSRYGQSIQKDCHDRYNRSVTIFGQSRCANSRYSIGAEQMALMPAQSKMPTIGVVLASLVLVVFFSSSLYALVSYFLIK